MSGTWADAGLRVAWTNFPDFGGIGDVLRADAVAYWKLDEASGTRADSTGRGHDLSDVQGDVSVGAGKVGNSAVFGGVNQQRLRCVADSDLIMSGADFYIALWAKLNTPTYYALAMRFDQFDEEYAVEFSGDLSRISLSLGNNGYVEANTFGDVTTGVWYFIEAYNRTDGIYGIAVNGGVFDTGVELSALPELSTPFTVGNLERIGGFSVQGAIDEIGVWRRLLTADERAYLYNGGDGRTLYP